MSIILDLIGISWLLLLIREQYKKGHTTFACILGILYSCVMMILAVPGPKWIFTIVSIIFVICTIRLILNESYTKWKDFWIEQSSKDGIERNLSIYTFIWVKVAYHFIEKHKPSRLSNFQTPEISTFIPAASIEAAETNVSVDTPTEISAEDEQDRAVSTPDSTDNLKQVHPTSEIIQTDDEEIDLTVEAEIVEESIISDEFVDL